MVIYGLDAFTCIMHTRTGTLRACTLDTKAIAYNLNTALYVVPYEHALHAQAHILYDLRICRLCFCINCRYHEYEYATASQMKFNIQMKMLARQCTIICDYIPDTIGLNIDDDG